MTLPTRIGVIIPAYKSEYWLEKTVLTVLAQKCTLPFEIKIVDDGSPDASALVAERLATGDSRVSLLQQSNAGVAAARNNGCSALSSAVDAVLFLDADDELERDALQNLANALGDQPTALAAYGLARFIDTSSKLFAYGEAERAGLSRVRPEQGRLVACDPSEPTSFDMLTVANWLNSPGQVLIWRRAFQDVGGFNINLRGPDDWDLWLRLSLRAPLAFVHQPVLRYRRHDGQVSRDVMGMNSNVQEMFDNLIATLPTADAAHLKEGFRLARGRAARIRMGWSAECLLRGELMPAAKHVRHALMDYLQLLRA